MTTIVFKDGVIAYDSRATRGDYVSTDKCDKRISRDGHDFFVSGCIGDADFLIDAYLTGSRKGPESAECSAIVVHKKTVLRMGLDKGALWLEKANNPDAIGSGACHAFTAMDMGADAKTAVKMAMKRDIGTGGRIRTFRLK